ncbi:hypothetical protein HDU92_000054 [Lobulomyces angularis]|nr:hypothetical protein HDU92_000054 [Lobulomyces angularis]
MGNFFNYIIAFASAIGGLLFGYEIGLIDQVLGMQNFAITFGIKHYNEAGLLVDTEQAKDIKGNVTFTFLLGCTVGAVIVSMMADILGRKRSILVGGFAFAVGGLLQALTGSIELFYFGRVVSGLGIGVLSMCVPLYISETAPTAVRGRMITVQQLMITIGILLAALVNLAIRNSQEQVNATEKQGSEPEWRMSLGLQVVPGVILVFLMFFMPYSPRWLEDRKRHAEAVNALSKIRSADENSAAIQAEYKEIKEGVEFERSIGNATWSELLKPGIINRVLIGVTLQFFQQWTGINVILYYASDLFTAMGFPYETASKSLNIVNSFVNVVGTLPGMYLIERIGRRKLLIFGGLGMSLSHYLVCLFIGLSKTGNASLNLGALIFVYVFILCFSSTWGPVVWVYQSEIFPLRIRAKGTGIATFSNWSMNAVIAKVTPIIIDAISFKFYIIFGSTCLVMSLFCVSFVPETMGKSLEEMDELFGKVNVHEVESQKKN